jgi:hypothetical protein
MKRTKSSAMRRKKLNTMRIGKAIIAPVSEASDDSADSEDSDEEINDDLISEVLISVT